MKKALVTGCSGQDGHYLSAHLRGLGYRVYGLVRRTSRVAEVPEGVEAIDGDVTDYVSIAEALKVSAADEVYNLAAQSFIVSSFSSPLATAQINALGAHNVFDACLRTGRGIKVYQAGTSEMFGGMKPGLLDESTPFHPRSPYACAKVYAHQIGVNYREAHGLFLCNGILFNHESPLRGEEFVTRKITRAIGRIKAGLQTTIELGDVSPRRDWGFAGDYVKAMHLMLQQPYPDDYVIGSGTSHSVLEFVIEACRVAGLKWTDVLRFNAGFKRPSEVNYLQSNPSKAKSVLRWAPEVDFGALVRLMVESDIALGAKEAERSRILT